jgi:hypothetical protein
METKVTEATIIRITHGPTARQADLALALAILSRMPDWPRWERCSDVQAAIELSTNTGAMREFMSDMVARTNGGAL